jgi:hypothetical protein
MLSEKQVDAVEQTAAELKRRREHRPAESLQEKPATVAGADKQASDDAAWARANLRFDDDKPHLDIANALRVLERHDQFKGRFKFNETLNKVMDKGTVMLEWRVAEVAAVMQERFMPGIPVDAVNQALVIHANNAMKKK